MQMDRFTTLAQEVLAGAQSAATGRGHAELTPLHILAAMLEDRQGVAGSILAVGGVLAIVSRIISGLYVDRKQVGYLTYVAKILAVGSVGYLFLAIGLPSAYFLGTVLAYGATWGVNGVLFMAVVRHRPERPAAVSGQVIAVGSIGGFVGPPIYGLVAENFGYRPAWMMAAAWVAIAATSIFMSGAARSEARLDGDSVADGASDAPAG